jgi:hypothetical protein
MLVRLPSFHPVVSFIGSSSTLKCTAVLPKIFSVFTSCGHRGRTADRRSVPVKLMYFMC